MPASGMPPFYHEAPGKASGMRGSRSVFWDGIKMEQQIPVEDFPEQAYNGIVITGFAKWFL